MEPEQTLVSIKAYAEQRGINPQNVYYYIRQKRIEKRSCPCCGSKSLIDEREADRVMGLGTNSMPSVPE